MRPFMASMLVAVLTVSAFAGYDYTITNQYYWDLTLANQQTLLMTGGGVNGLVGKDYSKLEIQNTFPYSAGAGGILSLDLGGSSQLEFSGGQVRNFTISGNATAVFSGGLINKIYSYQPVTYPNYIPGPHIEMIVKDHFVTNNILSGHWQDNSTYSIQLMNQSGYAAVIDNIKFTIVPEPATMLLLGLGGLLLRRKNS